MRRVFTLLLSICLMMLFSSISHARYYDPKIGRFLTADPIGLEGGFNLYAYVQNNPVNAIDPDGRLAFLLPAIPPALTALTKAAAFVGSAMIAGKLIADATDDDSDEGSSCPVDKDSPPDHPDFKPHKKKKGKQKIPWNKNRKGYPDRYGDYWEPVPDGHKGTHDPHWDKKHPDGSHTPIYPPKK